MTTPEDCDHEFEFEDQSFSHEFGTEQIYVWTCVHCGFETNKNPHPEDPYDDFS